MKVNNSHFSHFMNIWAPLVGPSICCNIIWVPWCPCPTVFLSSVCFSQFEGWEFQFIPIFPIAWEHQRWRKEEFSWGRLYQNCPLTFKVLLNSHTKIHTIPKVYPKCKGHFKSSLYVHKLSVEPPSSEFVLLFHCPDGEGQG